MKITAQLALSQVRENKKRTIGTILATSLSSALLTTVMCFATSGKKMLTDFLGDGYAGYAGAYQFIIIIPAFILGLLIAFMSVTVISNIFSASANKRIKEFGVLKCVGATKKQISETVIYESLWISIIGIPLGLILGTCLGYLGVKITGLYVDEMNELSKSIIMRPFSFALPFHVSAGTFIFSAVFSLVIVLFSANKPARKAKRITALQCIRGTMTEQIPKNVTRDHRLIEKIWGYEGSLGYRNIKRNKTGYKATIRALALGIMLILTTGSLVNQANEIKEWMSMGTKEINVDYCSRIDYETNNKTRREQRKAAVPISQETYEEITTRLAQFENTDVYGIGVDSESYHVILDEKMLTEDMKQAPDIFDENGEARIELIAVDRVHYEELCDSIGVPYGSNILINDYYYNDNGEMKYIIPYKNAIDKVTLITAAEERTSLQIDGIIYRQELPENRFDALAPWPVRVIVPNIEVRYFDWFCSPTRENEFMTYAREVMDEYYPILTEDSYVEQGYTVRISRADTLTMMLNIAIVLAIIIMYGFVILLILMGLASVIHTLTTNIKIRRREFAVLKSVGMTKRALEKMLYCESMICMCKAAVYGIFFGIALPYMMNLSLRKMFPVRYHIPWVTLFVGVVAIGVVVLLITKIEIGKIKKQNIIEDIRMDTM